MASRFGERRLEEGAPQTIAWASVSVVVTEVIRMQLRRRDLTVSKNDLPIFRRSSAAAVLLRSSVPSPPGCWLGGPPGRFPRQLRDSRRVTGDSQIRMTGSIPPVRPTGETTMAFLTRDPGMRTAHVNQKIRRSSTPGADPEGEKRLAHLMGVRDELIAKTAARKVRLSLLPRSPASPVVSPRAASAQDGRDRARVLPEVIRQHNLEGAAQGLRQSSVAPPGSGRLVGIPFVVSGAVVPRHRSGRWRGYPQRDHTSLVTKSINWAVLRIVALTTQTIGAATGVVGTMQDFKIGGSPNLFLDESWVLMDDTTPTREQFAGRACPHADRSNTAAVDVAATSLPAGQTLYTAVTRW